MWIQRFQIYKKSNMMLALVPNAEYYDNQRQAFAWVDEKGNKNEEYVILPMITFDKDAKKQISKTN